MMGKVQIFSNTNCNVQWSEPSSSYNEKLNYAEYKRVTADFLEIDWRPKQTKCDFDNLQVLRNVKGLQTEWPNSGYTLFPCAALIDRMEG
jgi:hypothetical protein